MKAVAVNAQLLAPVAIKRDRQSERSESVRFVAGTLVRGALASLYLRHHGQVDGTFEHLFLNEDTCRFGPMDPGPRIFPLTAASCKREGLGHALVDQLWFRVAQHLMFGQLPDDSSTPWRRCEQCGADMKPYEGHWHERAGRLEVKNISVHVATHVGIDRGTGTAADSMLYTLECLAPSGCDTDLYGWLQADDDALCALRRLLQDESWRISVGHARTRGYGDVRLRLGQPTAAPETRAAAQRWEQWSRDLCRFLDSPSFALSDLDPACFYFALSFPTGAVIVDRLLRYSVDPADMIDWLPPIPAVRAAFPIEALPTRQLESGGSVRWITAVTRHERVRGWNAAHGLPRQDEWAVARGAVYVYRFDGAEHEREQLMARLATLSTDGVGLRRNEGFGVVSISDEFHRRFPTQEKRTCTY